MNENEDANKAILPNLDDRTKSLATFEKLERALRLVEEAVKEHPSLKDLQLEPLMLSLADGLRIFSAKNSELNLQDLILKYDWWVGQRFYVRVVFHPAPAFPSKFCLPKTSRRVS